MGLGRNELKLITLLRAQSQTWQRNWMEKTTAHNTEKIMMTTAMTKKIKTKQKYYN